MIQPNLNDEIPKILYESGSVYANNETFHPQKVDNKIKSSEDIALYVIFHYRAQVVISGSIYLLFES